MAKLVDGGQLVELWEQGFSAREIQEKTGANQKTVRKYARQAGFTLRTKRDSVNPFAPAEITAMVAWWEEGHSRKWIGKQLGCQAQTVDRALIRLGIELEPRYKHSRNGGRHKTVRGYMVVWVRPDDPIYETAPTCNRFPTGSYILEHRVVMARHLGRP